MKQQDLLVELGTEELPPKALLQLSNSFGDEIVSSLKDANLSFGSVSYFATPRRLGLLIRDLDIVQPDRETERRGPAIKAAYDADGNPTKAAQGFARSCGVNTDQLSTLKTDRGEWLTYTLTEKGQPTEQIIPGFIEQSINKLPIPKRMRWGSRQVQFVRPVHWLVCLFGHNIIPCVILGVTGDRITYGHRFMSKGPITINTPSEYEQRLLEEGRVIASFDQRKKRIEDGANQVAKASGGIASINQDLLNEVTGLVEWPVPLLATFEKKYLDVPQEALIYTMQDNQKYFPVLDSNNKLMPYFITISNIESNNPQTVIEGNERVVRPRLADAAFFFETDKKIPLAVHNKLNKTAVFQNKLGTIFEKSERIASLAQLIAEQIGGDSTRALQAGLLAKADLTTNMVNEFAAMQGIMGHYLAMNEGIDAEQAEALEEQYLPRFATDSLPQTPTGITLALADRIDTLVGIFGIGLKPTGEKDPYGLRRIAIAILRIIIESKLPIDLQPLFVKASLLFRDRLDNPDVQSDVSEFLLSRYRSFYQDRGVSADTIISVQAVMPTKPFDFDQRVNAVTAFRKLAESDSLAAANKRVSNILNKQNSRWQVKPFDSSLLTEPAEQVLDHHLTQIESSVKPLLSKGEYTNTLKTLAQLHEPINSFFDEVMVMSDDIALRENRLALLSRLRSLFLQVADISLLQS